MKNRPTKKHKEAWYDEDFEIGLAADGSLFIKDSANFSEMLCTEVVRTRKHRAEMRTEKPKEPQLSLALPTELDMNLARLEIRSLNSLENSLMPLVMEALNAHLKSAENQLRIIRAEMADPGLMDIPESAELRRTIAEHWTQLNVTISSAGAFRAWA